MIRFARLLVVALLLIPSTARASDPEIGPSLRSLFSDAARARLDRLLPAEGPSGALAAAAGTERLPVGCATAQVSSLAEARRQRSGGLHPALAELLRPPEVPDPRRIGSADGAFSLHYSERDRLLGPLSIDADRDGVPDLAEHVIEALQAGRSFLVGEMELPWTPGERAFDVFLAPLGRGVEGYTVGAFGPRGRWQPRFIVLDAGLDRDRVMPASVHQVAHLVFGSFDAARAAWWAEASASFLTLAATGDLHGPEAGLRARLRAPELSLRSDRLLLMQGSLLWPLFLVERTGDPSLLRAIWEEVGSAGIDPIAATRDALARSVGLSLEDAHREYVAWNLFTGARDDGRHYSVGASLPETPLPAIGPGLPFRTEERTVEPLGSAAFLLLGDGRRGGLEIEVAADGGAPAADLLLAYRSYGPDRVIVPVPLGEERVGRVSVPSGDLEQAWILLRNSAVAPGETTRFQIRGRHDPYAPYDLASFNARPAGASLQLEWSTASEQGMLGWNIHRSETPDGAFTRLNDVALPALGDSTVETGYIFVDASARPGRRYYYLLEGLTVSGLAERSHVVSGRIPPRR
ncbi:MAG: hypothetical protein ACE5JH_05735 [Acidobacteriota bacterium]